MTNQEICLIVYKKINIKGICIKLGMYQNTEDIQQIVYEILMNYDNKTLNEIYNNKALLSFVYKCVKNNKTQGEWKSIYVKERKQHFLEETDEMTDEKEIYNSKLDYLDYIYSYENIIKSGMTEVEKSNLLNILFLKKKIIGGYTLSQMAKKYKVGRNYMNNCIQNGKRQIKEWYDNDQRGCVS